MALAAEIASVPEHIRGYGHVKDAHLHDGEGARGGIVGEVEERLPRFAAAA